MEVIMGACLCLLTLLFLTVFPVTIHSVTVYIPDDFSTIQAGIDACTDGDTVIVRDGTYTGNGNRDIDYDGRAIVVMSENGPEGTIIDCEGGWLNPHRGFLFQHGEDSNSVLKGFTITNGNIDTNGAGVYCDGSSPTIIDNIIRDNYARYYGGGIYCSNSSATISNNIIENNGADEKGGGIGCESASPHISDNRIAGNIGWVGGGGIYTSADSHLEIRDCMVAGNRAGDFGDGGGILCHGSAEITDCVISGNETYYDAAGIYSSGSITVTRCTIIDNQAGGSYLFTDPHGGGIYCAPGSTPTIRECTITGNVAYSIDYGGNLKENAIPIAGYGGGIACQNSSAVIENNIISRNISVSGGGFYCYSSSPRLRSNTISDNVSYWAGGGIFTSASSPNIHCNTITRNAASDSIGGGICCFNSSAPIITNSILWGDTASFGNEIYLDGSTIEITYSNIEGGWSGVGNIDADPVFVLPEKMDYRLLWESPCIDTGNPDSLDADGTRSDMGAHYFNQNDYLTLYLTPDTTEVSSGQQLGVTYTVINRWGQAEPFRGLTQAILPDGTPFNIIGPANFSIPANFTVQRHIDQYVPINAPLGRYEYWTRIGLPPSTLYDEDRFTFTVVR